MPDIIQTLWIGPELSVMEQLCLRSFLDHGHEVHLYVYDEVRHIPPSIVVKDANAVLSASMIFQYKEQKSYAGFANYFRYKLLLERGGWWVDTDMICHRAFDFEEDYVFSSEWFKGKETINAGAIKAPPASDMMAYAWHSCQAKKVEDIVWGETGPRLVAEAVGRFDLGAYVKPPAAFCPINFSDWAQVLDPTITWAFDDTTYAIHFWNEMWREAAQDKNRRYDPGSLYEHLKRRFLDG